MAGDGGGAPAQKAPDVCCSHPYLLYTAQLPVERDESALEESLEAARGLAGGRAVGAAAAANSWQGRSPTAPGAPADGSPVRPIDPACRLAVS